MTRIKKRPNAVNKIKIPITNNQELDYPVFCFKHLQTTPKNDYKFYADFVVRLRQISSLSWVQINTSQRHGFGTEKTPVAQIKPQLPRFVTPEIDHLLVFRANGDNRPFLGLRNQNIFHVIFLEEKFGDVYNHG